MQVVAAIIFYNNKVVVTQRKLSKDPNFSFKYEFPGGKVEKKEALLNALKRELKEELDIEVFDIKHFYSYDFQYNETTINLKFYTCKTDNVEFKLKVHESFKLMSIDKLRQLDWLEADYRVIKKIEEIYL